MSDDNDNIFGRLHDALTEQLLKRVKEGTATAADLNVARQWLNDNGAAADPRRNKALAKLGESIADLPFDDDGEPPARKAH